MGTAPRGPLPPGGEPIPMSPPPPAAWITAPTGPPSASHLASSAHSGFTNHNAFATEARGHPADMPPSVQPPNGGLAIPWHACPSGALHPAAPVARPVVVPPPKGALSHF